ncbi:CotS family spore coat protein [Clostridium sp. SM-530-WT-3G]|uniref:CotS family spore coat protein n=1 Tax=Clostridium sp. SM-530-WT-3G TaxID=2725303 RepID=UPI00145D8204|nr:CotS family spore coat protein [Clostridium sp. SM-530-WT-3G]NME82620.1 CotS family spore coat protein [Clostridium sp. SM-530-WT-3G]
MNRIRYSEKNYLCEYDLSLEFFNELGIKINDVTPLRKVFILSTDNGRKILKKVNYDIPRINFISDSLKYVKKDYKNIISYNVLKNKKNYLKWNNDLYVVMDILEGREASFTNPVEIRLCAENIALMHNASQGIREYLNNKYATDVLDVSIIDKYIYAYDDLNKIKKMVLEYDHKNEFDELFMDNVDKYIGEINILIDSLKKSDYLYLRSLKDKITICHNDLAYHNFLIKNQDVSIIDFDFMTIDLRINDLADFVLKAIKNAAFDMNKMDMVIDSYEEIAPLDMKEKKLMSYILRFPKDFYAISMDYYYKKKKWDYEVFLNRLKGKLNNEIYRLELIDTLNQKFKI